MQSESSDGIDGGKRAGERTVVSEGTAGKVDVKRAAAAALLHLHSRPPVPLLPASERRRRPSPAILFHTRFAQPPAVGETEPRYMFTKAHIYPWILALQREKWVPYHRETKETAWWKSSEDESNHESAYWLSHVEWPVEHISKTPPEQMSTTYDVRSETWIRHRVRKWMRRVDRVQSPSSTKWLAETCLMTSIHEPKVPFTSSSSSSSSLSSVSSTTTGDTGSGIGGKKAKPKPSDLTEKTLILQHDSTSAEIRIGISTRTHGYTVEIQWAMPIGGGAGGDGEMEDEEIVAAWHDNVAESVELLQWVASIYEDSRRKGTEAAAALLRTPPRDVPSMQWATARRCASAVRHFAKDSLGYTELEMRVGLWLASGFLSGLSERRWRSILRALIVASRSTRDDHLPLALPEPTVYVDRYWNSGKSRLTRAYSWDGEYTERYLVLKPVDTIDMVLTGSMVPHDDGGENLAVRLSAKEEIEYDSSTEDVREGLKHCTDVHIKTRFEFVYAKDRADSKEYRFRPMPGKHRYRQRSGDSAQASEDKVTAIPASSLSSEKSHSISPPSPLSSTRTSVSSSVASDLVAESDDILDPLYYVTATRRQRGFTEEHARVSPSTWEVEMEVTSKLAESAILPTCTRVMLQLLVPQPLSWCDVTLKQSHAAGKIRGGYAPRSRVPS